VLAGGDGPLYRLGHRDLPGPFLPSDPGDRRSQQGRNGGGLGRSNCIRTSDIRGNRISNGRLSHSSGTRSTRTRSLNHSNRIRGSYIRYVRTGPVNGSPVLGKPGHGRPAGGRLRAIASGHTGTLPRGDDGRPCVNRPGGAVQRQGTETRLVSAVR
jgi:hypothetical protein